MVQILFRTNKREDGLIEENIRRGRILTVVVRVRGSTTSRATGEKRENDVWVR